MALSAIRHGRTLSLARALTSSISPSTAALGSNSNSNVGAGFSHLYGFEKPSPQWRHLLARCMSWTELKDCKHWFIALKFPNNPAPTREEMIDTYVKTLSNVLGSEEAAKKRIYALSTTAYTGFQCKIDEATSEKLKEQPYVNWVLPDGYGDPPRDIFGVKIDWNIGDRYDNGVITPDPNPPKPFNERPRNRNYDRPRFDRQRDFRPMEGRDNMPREYGDNRRGDNYNYRSTERRDTMQRDQFGNRPPFEQRNPMQGYQRDNMQPDDRRGPMPPIDRRDSYQGERRDTLYEGQREAVRGEGMPLTRGLT